MRKFNLVINLSLIFASYLMAQNNADLHNLYKLKFVRLNAKTNLVYYTISDSLPHPTILFIRGNGATPVFIDGGPSGFTPFNYFNSEKYNIAIVAKPGLPIFVDSVNYPHLKISGFYSNFNYVEDSTFTTPTTYLLNNNLDSLTEMHKKAISFINKQKWHKRNELVVWGHSQGAHVAAMLSILDNMFIGKVVLGSSNVYSRFHQFVYLTRINTLYGLIKPEDAQKYIDTIYKEYSKVINAKGSNRLSELYDSDSYLSWYSVTKNKMKDNMLKTKIPILLMYGTEDFGILNNDQIMFEFIDSNKQNLTLKVYQNYDHNFFEYNYNDKGELLFKKFHWDDIFLETLNWIGF